MLTTSLATRLLKNLLLSIDVAEVDEVGVGGGGDCKDETVERSLSKNLNKAIGYLSPDARRAFTQLRQTFTKAPILWHFDSECHIQIEIDMSSYAIGGVLSQLTLDNFGRCHLLAYYLRKMIKAKTWYKTYNSEFLAIVEVFITWQHYLKGCKHEVLMLTDYNNFYRFMKTKNLSSCQVWWAQELSQYYFQIDYC